MWNVVPETTEDEALGLLAHHIVRYTETIGELLRAEESRLAACDRGSDLQPVAVAQERLRSLPKMLHVDHTCINGKWLFGFQRGLMVASRSQLGLPA
jgi:hypothetical protein